MTPKQPLIALLSTDRCHSIFSALQQLISVSHIYLSRRWLVHFLLQGFAPRIRKKGDSSSEEGQNSPSGRFSKRREGGGGGKQSSRHLWHKKSAGRNTATGNTATHHNLSFGNNRFPHQIRPLKQIKTNLLCNDFPLAPHDLIWDSD